MNIAAILQSEDEMNDQLIWIDHREEEESIVSWVAESIGEPGALSPLWKDDQLWAVYKGEEFHLPLTISMHDRYVAIDSLACILKQDYGFWLETESLGGDTHGLLVLKHEDFKQLSEGTRVDFLAKFTPLELGHDYFSGLTIPYLGNPDNNPNLAQESAEQDQAMKAMVQSAMESPEMKKAMEDFRSDLANIQGKALKKAIFRYKLIRFVILFVVIFAALRLIRYLFS